MRAEGPAYSAHWNFQEIGCAAYTHAAFLGYFKRLQALLGVDGSPGLFQARHACRANRTALANHTISNQIKA
jgi:hypothetical protein